MRYPHLLPALLLGALLLGAAPGAPPTDPKAELDYGLTLLEQDPKAREEARVWIQKAADHGLAEAWYQLGYQGLGTEKAPYYYERAAEKGYAPAFGLLLDALLFRAGPAADTVKAKKFADLARRFKIALGYGAAERLATVDICYAAGSAQVPAQDRAVAERAAPPAGCDLLKDARRWSQYKECLLSDAAPDNRLVAELYANGWGVARDPRLAIALVCHGSDVPAELTSMVEALDATRSEKALAQPFLFCDHITSGANGGVCADRAENVRAVKRAATLAKLTARWTRAQKVGLRGLQAAAEAFFNAHASLEIDMSGTARGQIFTDEVARMRSALAENIAKLEAGRLPSHGDFAGADGALNARYREIVSRTDWRDFGTVDADGVRQTQHKWIAYRDAWVRFGRLRYPKVAADDWKAWLTRERLAQFKLDLLPR